MWIGQPLGAGLAFLAVFLAGMSKSKAILGSAVVPMMAAWLLALHYSLSTSEVAVF
jgi:hypothetical protein